MSYLELYADFNEYDMLLELDAWSVWTVYPSEIYHNLYVKTETLCFDSVDAMAVRLSSINSALCGFLLIDLSHDTCEGIHQ